MNAIRIITIAVALLGGTAPEPAAAGMCFLRGSRVSGLNRICYYDCATGRAAITIPSHKICPVTIDR